MTAFAILLAFTLQQTPQQPAQSGATLQTPAQPGSGQKVAQGEEPAKPTRSFFPALMHNLGDDIKHIPRRNTLYWLAAGTAFGLAIHPADDNLNTRLGGSSTFDNVVKPGKYIGGLPFLLGSSSLTYIVGRTTGKKRVQHMGMDLIEGTILSEGLTQGI
jgi:hypothetical protein